MSADVLRQAAALMRERAEAAAPAPWKQDSSVPGDTVIFQRDGEWLTNISDGQIETTSGVVAFDHDRANGEHIASWHPAVALAVADWLDREADLYERLETMRLEVSKKGFEMSWGESTQDEALAVARAYLGESA